ncbi:MAG: hypothetical protein LBG65_06765 [Puniceicoccales bacterium]|jgi:hypothetical protein|nr:hypothetical protein [Puniceicoccales bacterium]
MSKNITAKISARRTRQIRVALQRAQVAAAKKALEFGQLLYVSQGGRVVGVDPRSVLQAAHATA